VSHETTPATIAARIATRTAVRPLDEVREIYHRPLLDLVFEAASVHRRHHDASTVQCSTLLSVKTGGCPEDCGYCPQSSRHDSPAQRTQVLDPDAVETEARRAKERGADRFCMGAAWREVKDGPDFEKVLEMVRRVKAHGLETCATLGMLDASQAERLREAGLDYYNHNLDTSPEHYARIITTRTYDDRLETLSSVRSAGLKVCCGGIVGMGESDDDRIGLLHQLASLDPHPESVPVNALVPVPGTPLAGTRAVDWSVVVRTVATARILMPTSMVRLSAGRAGMAESTHAMCFLAGANSIFLGDRLLTTPNPAPDDDGALLLKLGLGMQAAARTE
jgi:biotin synthase